MFCSLEPTQLQIIWVIKFMSVKVFLFASDESVCVWAKNCSFWKAAPGWTLFKGERVVWATCMLGQYLMYIIDMRVCGSAYVQTNWESHWLSEHVKIHKDKKGLIMVSFSWITGPFQETRLFSFYSRSRVSALFSCCVFSFRFFRCWCPSFLFLWMKRALLFSARSPAHTLLYSQAVLPDGQPFCAGPRWSVGNTAAPHQWKPPSDPETCTHRHTDGHGTLPSWLNT